VSQDELFAEPAQGALLTLPEAAAILNVPESWLRRRVAGRTVPFVRLGRYIRFTRDHLARIINEAEETPLLMAPHGLTRRARPRRVV
jgi:excisionase family DNA binding protein